MSKAAVLLQNGEGEHVKRTRKLSGCKGEVSSGLELLLTMDCWEYGKSAGLGIPIVLHWKWRDFMICPWSQVFLLYILEWMKYVYRSHGNKKRFMRSQLEVWDVDQHMVKKMKYAEDIAH